LGNLWQAPQRILPIASRSSPLPWQERQDLTSGLSPASSHGFSRLRLSNSTALAVPSAVSRRHRSIISLLNTSYADASHQRLTDTWQRTDPAALFWISGDSVLGSGRYAGSSVFSYHENSSVMSCARRSLSRSKSPMSAAPPLSVPHSEPQPPVPRTSSCTRETTGTARPLARPASSQWPQKRRTCSRRRQTADRPRRRPRPDPGARRPSPWALSSPRPARVAACRRIRPRGLRPQRPQ